MRVQRVKEVRNNLIEDNQEMRKILDYLERHEKAKVRKEEELNKIKENIENARLK